MENDPGTHCSTVWPLWDEALTEEIKASYGITGIGELFKTYIAQVNIIVNVVAEVNFNLFNPRFLLWCHNAADSEQHRSCF